MFKVTVLALTFVGACAGQVMADFQSISDGDFEALPNFVSPASGSTVAGDWVFSNNARVLGSVGNPGKVAALEAGGLSTSDPTIAQLITGLTPGATYDVFWDLAMNIDYGGQSVNGPSFGVFLDTQTFGSALFLGQHLSASYAGLSTSFVATTSSHTLIFAGELDGRSNGAGRTDVSYYIDNISLSASSAVPEPSSCTVMLFGAAILISGSLRRRRKN